uniref:Uncharacterized protein n=1 Tax=viral metagenome TaxID=1070528 RepID=A0A6C0KT06_9ZZZZ
MDLPWIIAYVPNAIIMVLLLSIFALPKYGLFTAMLQGAAIMFYSYVAHIIAHFLSRYEWINTMNPHINIHHRKLWDVPRWVDLLIESFYDLSTFATVLIAQSYFEFEWIHPWVVIAAGITYTLIHIFDYSIFHPCQYHQEHHQHTFCNYGPEIFDHLLHTRCDPSSPYRNTIKESAYTFLACIITYVLKQYTDYFPDEPNPPVPRSVSGSEETIRT